MGNQLQSPNSDNIAASGENSRKIFQEVERCVSRLLKLSSWSELTFWYCEIIDPLYATIIKNILLSSLKHKRVLWRVETSNPRAIEEWICEWMSVYQLLFVTLE